MLLFWDSSKTQNIRKIQLKIYKNGNMKKRSKIIYEQCNQLN